MTANETDPLIGSVLGGRYEITARIDRGGTAVVYRGIDRRLSRVVAVKVIHSDLAGDPEYVRRFDREARAAAILSHPNIVAVFDQGRAGERPYIVMEFIRGQSLRSVIRSSAPLPPAIALGYAHEVAKALAAAHEAGMIHRDIKPENVLITTDGQVKVTDFGLAKTATSVTTTGSQGMIMGTMSYMSPEIPQSGAATMASDVYSTGVVLYEMLTGRKPHVGDDASQVLYKHVHEDVPPPSQALAGQARARIPDYVDALVVACTARVAARRPPNGTVLEERIAEARQALDAGRMHDAGLVREFTTAGDPEQTPVAPTTRPAPRLSPAPRPRQDTPVRPAPPPLKLQPARTSRPAPRHRRAAGSARRRVLIGLALLVVAAVVAGIGTGWWWLAAGRWSTVPVVTNGNAGQAQTALAAAELDMVTQQEYSETVKTGLVIRTDPPAGQRVVRNSTVTVWVSKGAERYPMPTVAGMDRSAAEDAIRSAHLGVGTVTEVWSDTVPQGQVVSASQKAGTPLKPDTTIDLTVSKGRQPVPIPNVVGQASTAAADALTKAGFTVKTADAHSCDIAAGQVMDQKPVPDTKHPDLTGYKGDTITLTVSTGPATAVVPEVTGKSQGEAVQMLKDAGFLNVEISRVWGGIFFTARSTDPPAGSTASVCTITLNVV